MNFFLIEFTANNCDKHIVILVLKRQSVFLITKPLSLKVKIWNAISDKEVLNEMCLNSGFLVRNT